MISILICVFRVLVKCVYEGSGDRAPIEEIEEIEETLEIEEI